MLRVSTSEKRGLAFRTVSRVPGAATGSGQPEQFNGAGRRWSDVCVRIICGGRPAAVTLLRVKQLPINRFLLSPIQACHKTNEVEVGSESKHRDAQLRPPFKDGPAQSVHLRAILLLPCSRSRRIRVNDSRCTPRDTIPRARCQCS